MAPFYSWRNRSRKSSENLFAITIIKESTKASIRSLMQNSKIVPEISRSWLNPGRQDCFIYRKNQERANLKRTSPSLLPNVVSGVAELAQIFPNECRQQKAKPFIRAGFNTPQIAPGRVITEVVLKIQSNRKKLRTGIDTGISLGCIV